MTIKQDIERSADQLGRTIRRALSDFSKETGMQASIDIEWVSARHVSEQSDQHHVARIVVNVGGVSVDV